MTRDERQAWCDANGIPRLERGQGARRELVAPVAAPLVRRLTETSAIAFCYATAPSLRAMAFIDTGYLWGERSFPRWIKREVQRGRLEHWRMPPGTYWPKLKQGAPKGSQLNRFEGEAQRRERLHREKIARRAQRIAAKKRRAADRAERTAGSRPRIADALPQTIAVLIGRQEDAVPLELAADRWRGLLAAATPAPAPLPAKTPAPELDAASFEARRTDALERARAWARSNGLELPAPDDGEPPY